jgi:hypothetical protein
LPSRIDGFELRQVLHKASELGAVAAQQRDVVDQGIDAAERLNSSRKKATRAAGLPGVLLIALRARPVSSHAWRRR